MSERSRAEEIALEHRTFGWEPIVVGWDEADVDEIVGTGFLHMERMESGSICFTLFPSLDRSDPRALVWYVEGDDLRVEVAEWPDGSAP